MKHTILASAIATLISVVPAASAQEPPPGHADTGCDPVATGWSAGGDGCGQIAGAGQDGTSASGRDPGVDAIRSLQATAHGRYFSATGGEDDDQEAVAGHDYATAAGSGAWAGGAGASAFGSGALAADRNATAGGFNSAAVGEYATALGAGSRAEGESSIAIGGYIHAMNGDTWEMEEFPTEASGYHATAIGAGARALNDGALAMGASAYAGGTSASAIQGNAFGDYSTAIGVNSVAAGQSSTAMGAYSQAGSDRSMILGSWGSAHGDSATAVGVTATASGGFGAAFGYQSAAEAENSLALGAMARGLANDSVAIGFASISDRAGTISVGSAIDDPEFGFVPFQRQITNVADGTEQFDAVNVRQLQDAMADNRYFTAQGDDDNDHEAVVEGDFGTAAGSAAYAGALGATALGSGAFAFNHNATAAGFNSVAMGDYATAYGAGSEATGESSVAIGGYQYAMDGESWEMRELPTVASGDLSTAVGARARALNTGSTAIGAGAFSSGWMATSIDGNAQGDRSIAIGTNATVAGESSIVMGYNASVGGSNSIALGAWSTAFGDYAAAVGTAARAPGHFSTAHGYQSHAQADRSLALGGYAHAPAEYSVALGYRSLAERAHSVSVGSTGAERQIVNVAAGTEGTDAVNLDQLKALADQVGEVAGNAIVYDDGTRASVTFAGVEGTLVTNLAVGEVAAESTDAVTGGQLFETNQRVGRVEVRVDEIEGWIGDLEGVAANAVSYDDDVRGRVTLAGEDGTVITNLATGAIDAGSTEAVNGGQLHGALESAAAALGGGTVTSADGRLIGTAFAVQGRHYDSVGDAMGALDGALAGLDRRLVDLEQNGNRGGGGGLPVGDGQGLAVGKDSVAVDDNDTAVGHGALVAAESGTAVGSGSRIAAEASNAVAVGADASVEGASGTALGQGASVIAEGSVALGHGSVAEEANTVSVGHSDQQRRITQVADGVNGHDAVNVAQMDAGDARTLDRAKAYADERISVWEDNFTALRSEIDDRFRHQDSRIDRMGAMSGAYAGMALNTAGLAGQNRVGLGVGSQGGEQAIAIGYQRALGNRASLSFGGAISGGESSVSAGAGFSW